MFAIFDREWNFMRINESSQKAPADFTLPKPQGMAEMFEYADKLSKAVPVCTCGFL